MLSARSHKKTKKKDRSPNTSRDLISPVMMADEGNSQISKRDKKSKKEPKTDRASKRAVDLDQSLVIPEENDDSGEEKNRRVKKSKRSRN